MTNFEFYKDEILRLVAKGDSIALLNGKPVSCNDVSCKDCDREGVCYEHYLIGWLFAEHVEKPKINNKTKMFFDAIETGWVSRDENGLLYVFAVDNKPTKSISAWSCGRIVDTIRLPKSILPFLTLDFIKWEDNEPWSVEDIRSLEVVD